MKDIEQASSLIKAFLDNPTHPDFEDIRQGVLDELAQSRTVHVALRSAHHLTNSSLRAQSRLNLMERWRAAWASLPKRCLLASARWQHLVAGVTVLVCLILLGSQLRSGADLIEGHGYLFSHNFLFSSGNVVDITNRIVTIKGQTYIKDPPGRKEEKIPIVVDYKGGHIYDEYDNQIGFIYHASPP